MIVSPIPTWMMHSYCTTRVLAHTSTHTLYAIRGCAHTQTYTQDMISFLLSYSQCLENWTKYLTWPTHTPRCSLVSITITWLIQLQHTSDHLKPYIWSGRISNWPYQLLWWNVVTSCQVVWPMLEGFPFVKQYKYYPLKVISWHYFLVAIGDWSWQPTIFPTLGNVSSNNGLWCVCV